MVTFHRRLPKFDYLKPKTINEALALLSEHKGKAKLIAGGTDLVPKLKRREIESPEYLIDLKNIPDLDYIEYDWESGLKIGPLTTIHSLEASPVVKEKFSVLFDAVQSMASVQVRNKGTLAGNICNAVPSADTAPALLTLEAKLKLAGPKSERTVNIEEFFTGPSETVLNGEILREIHIPSLPSNGRGKYLKLTPRSSMDLAIVGVAAVIIVDCGVCNDIRIALGAVAPTPMRARVAEGILRGQKLTRELIDEAAKHASRECRPINDHRASAEYRCEMVRVLTKRAIEQAIS
jgi:carbon-monoxide dehydrogenase medium subunit